MPTTNRSKKTANSRPRTALPAWVRKSLRARLLGLGGAKVLWQRAPHAALVAALGQPFPQRVTMRPGGPRRRHASAAELWAEAPDRYRLVTGYALSVGRWVPHSWVVEGEDLYETAGRFDRYFGVALPPWHAFQLWFENVFEHYPGGKPPPGFWESHPGVVAVFGQLVRMSAAERLRTRAAGPCGG